MRCGTVITGAKGLIISRLWSVDDSSVIGIHIAVDLGWVLPSANRTSVHVVEWAMPKDFTDCRENRGPPGMGDITARTP